VIASQITSKAAPTDASMYNRSPYDGDLPVQGGRVIRLMPLLFAFGFEFSKLGDVSLGKEAPPVHLVTLRTHIRIVWILELDLSFCLYFTPGLTV
jgi:hypothetical protein